MKFQRLETFYTHLEESLPQHASAIYCVVLTEAFERKKILENILTALQKSEEADSKRCLRVEEALFHLRSPSLFRKKSIALLDISDALANAEKQQLEQYVINPQRDGWLLIGMSSATLLHSLYEKGKKEMVVLDLSAEKPWEKEERIKKWVVAFVNKVGKALTAAAKEALWKKIPLEVALLEQEVLKLICYVGEKKEITDKDVEAIVSSISDIQGWRLAEALIWKKKHEEEVTDLSMLLPLIGQMRYHLEMGLLIASLLEKKQRQEEIEQQLPQFKPSQLKRFIPLAANLGKQYFKQGILELFALEFSAKNAEADASILFNRFVAKLIR